MRLRRARFGDLIDRQLELFEREHRGLIDDCIAALERHFLDRPARMRDANQKSGRNEGHEENLSRRLTLMYADQIKSAFISVNLSRLAVDLRRKMLLLVFKSEIKNYKS